jgi:hypothetical protein
VGQVGKIIGGAALIAGAIALDVATGGAAFAAGAEEFTAFLAIIGSTGASLIASGASGLLATPPPGQGVASQNPIKPWDIVYGQVKTGGTFVDIESNGGILANGSNTYDKCTNFVVMLAAHAIHSVDEVRLNGKPIPLGPGGSGAESTEWSYSPPSNQNQVAINSVTRAGGVVTMVLAGGIPGQNGLPLFIHRVTDHTFNGTFTVTQPNPNDNTTFTYLCGGADGSSSGGSVYTTYPDYKNRVHVDRTTCLGKHTSTFPEFMATSSLWTAAHKNLGKASIYIAFYYDSTVFANGLPQMSFVVSGKADIYDPRLGDVGNAAAHVYTTNAALIIADYLTNKTWGYGLSYGTDVPLAQLIAAANICDETVALAAGGTEPRYTINMTFNLSRGRGAVLQDMLAACAGRITIQSGQYVIVPGAWVGPSVSLTQSNLIGPVEYKPIMAIRDVCNGVKGTYASPVTNWQSADIPPYAEDVLHRYASDRWLTADGGVRLWKDVSFPATTSAATAQRLAKIELERTRREGRLTLHCDMSAYPAVALDIVEFSYPRYGWTNKTFEVLSSTLVMQTDPNGGAPRLGVDLDLAEADSTVYDWSTTEELTPADTASPAIANGNFLTGPQFLELESGPATTYTGADGVHIPRILAAWLTAPDATIQSGGTIQVEYQKVGDVLWTPCGGVSGAQTQAYISGVVSGSQYNVQVQGVTATGIQSGWAQAGPITVSATSTSIVASSVTYPDGTPVANLEPAQAGADMTAAQALAHTGASGQLVPNGNFLLGNIDGWISVQGANPYYINDPGIVLQGGVGAGSPTFSTIPGQKYRFIWHARSNGGTQSVTFQIRGGATYAPNMWPSGTYQTDVMYNGSVYVGLPGADYDYDWTCPAGVYFVSLLTYNNGTDAMAVGPVSAQSFAAAAQWGADQTLTNTAAGIINQGTLATVNQVNTGNIVANAVNSSAAYSSNVLVNIPANTVTVIAQLTLSTGGGYVKVRAMMEMFANSTTDYAYPSIRIFKGNSSGTQIAFYGNAFVPLAISSTTGGGGSVIAIEALDASPGLAQQYTVTAYANAVAMQCDSISFVVENAKV